jgi:hypothetical protein
MNFLARLLRGIAYVPAIVHGTEAIFGSKTGANKKDAALAMVSSAVGLTDALANKDVLQPDKFQEGMSQIIDGVVAVFNSSAWAKK